MVFSSKKYFIVSSCNKLNKKLYITNRQCINEDDLTIDRNIKLKIYISKDPEDVPCEEICITRQIKDNIDANAFYFMKIEFGFGKNLNCRML